MIPTLGLTEVLVVMFFVPLLWLIFKGLHVASIGCRSKKQKETLKKKYKFFRQPWIIKTFFIGLNGVVSKALPIIAFIDNILLINCCLLSIVHLFIYSKLMTNILMCIVIIWSF